MYLDLGVAIHNVCSYYDYIVEPYELQAKLQNKTDRLMIIDKWYVFIINNLAKIIITYEDYIR